MASSSGTYAFSPAAGDLILTSFSRIGKAAAELTAEHMMHASIEANLLMIEWGNRGVNLWESTLISIPPSGAALTQGTQTIALPANTIAVLIAYIELSPGVQASQTDRIMGALSTVEYASQTNKLYQGPPTSYWFDKQVVPQLWLWPCPDSGGPYYLFARVLSQVQDVVVPGGVNINAPVRFYDAFVAGMAARLAVHYAPEREDKANMAWERSWSWATDQDSERRALNLMPMLGGYYT